ncbi:putative protein S-acyltransferase 13 [Nosema granulosis]|uniref:Palmitoyltransferase n=1 Tax=Nosema granulosis TaxID=83296 RepID=A0A9P6KZ22_9MICR|nr:putative protein S-acyltransferase 13 [Nosema granulosis]
MKSRKLLDKIRFSLLVTTVVSAYAVSYKLIVKTKEVKSLFSGLLFLFEFFSLFYLVLTNIRRGYVDYVLVDSSLGKVRLSQRYCRTCNHYKPERTHHCSTCDRCIKKMDHHCMWMSVCVNYDNHGDFIRFIFFTALSNLYLSLCYFYNLFLFYSKDIKLSTPCLTLMCCFFLISLALWVIPFLLLRIQMKLILRNMTFIEGLTYSDYDLDGNPQVCERYSKGTFENLVDVFGPAKYLFLWKPSGDGISYSTEVFIPESLYYEYV